MFEFEIPFSMFDNEDYLLDVIFMKRMVTNGNICIKPSFSSGDNSNDKYYERIRFEEAFCNMYEKIEHPEEVFLEVIKLGGITVDGKFVWIYEDVPLAKVKEVHDKIKLFTADIKNSTLSPFEKTMALYMIATHFIESYKGNSADIRDSDSSVMHILSDDEDGYKIKCAGYTDLFCRMAYECGIHTKELEISFMKNHDKKDIGVHSVAVVDLDDEKYGIHGSFICDVRGESDDIYTRRKQKSILPDFTLNLFCLPFSDFNTYLTEFEGSKYVEYGINNKRITGEEKKYLSNDRIDIMTISDAFKRVDEFRYGRESVKITDERIRTLDTLLDIRDSLDVLTMRTGQSQTSEMYNQTNQSSK